MARDYLQGKFTPKNPHKYVGDVNSITYRSSWECKLFLYLDSHPGILQWNSEECVIPYLSPLDNQMHRYFVDCVVKYKTKSGEIKMALVEVKPKSQVLPPKPTKNKKRLIEETKTYAVNQSKWAAAKAYCQQQGFDFIILTEHELGIK